MNPVSRTGNTAVFKEALLPEGNKRWGSFGAGMMLEAVALAAVVIAPMLMPQKLEAIRNYWVMPLEAPHIEAWKPQPPKPTPVKRVVVKETPPPKPPEPVVVPDPPKPKIYNPVVSAPVARVVPKKNVANPDVQIAKAFPDQNPLLIGSSAIPTLKKPREEVQTGGFGDPNSVPDNGKTNKNPNMTQLGAYDMPKGAGTGNGTGGANGAKGVVASTGFGNGVAQGGPGAKTGVVKQGLFGDENGAVAAPKKQAAAVSNTKPVEILFAPRGGQYTAAAREAKIEGDVVVQVVFTASGEVQVKSIVQGLGYGLDEAAQVAARQIRFNPAQQDGRPVDFVSNVRIKFALAY
jgi:TonB family protein